MVKYFGHQSSGAFYILDEPSLGLNTKYQKVILDYLNALKERDNTILLVEHSEFFQKHCDELVLMGPGSGAKGGEVVFQGNPKRHKFTKNVVTDAEKWPKLKKSEEMKFTNICGDYLEPKSFNITKGVLTWVHGKPGSGKTSYFIHGIANALNFYFEGKYLIESDIEVEEMEGVEEFDGVYFIDSNLGKITSRSTVGTYVGVLPLVRKYFLIQKKPRSLDI